MNLKVALENPYPNAVRYIVSEILQLLLVVERIKANQDSYQRLKSLEKITNEFMNFSDYPAIYTPSDAKKYPRDILCSVLDEGLGASSFFMKLLRYIEYKSTPFRWQAPTTACCVPEEDQRIKVWTENMSKIIDNQKFHFESLNPWRLHYPHLQILLAYMHGKELLQIVNELRSLNVSNYIDSAEEWVAQEFAHTFNNNQKLSNQQLIFEQHITRRAIEEFLEEFNKIVSKAKMYLDWSFQEGSYFPRPKIEKQKQEWKTLLGQNLGEQPVLCINLLEADIRKAIKEGDLDLIADVIANSLAHEVQPEKFGKNFTDSFGYRKGLIDIYEQYSCFSERTQLLYHAEDDLQLSYETLLRGIGFSVWREKNQLKTGMKTSVLKATEEFLSEEKGMCYCFGKANTIKQSYEEVKGYAKRSISNVNTSRLVRLISSQMTTRLSIYTPKIRHLFAPFNIEYENKIRDVLHQLGKILGKDESGVSYEDVCAFFETMSGLENNEVIKTINVKYNRSLSEINKLSDREIIFNLLHKDILVRD